MAFEFITQYDSVSYTPGREGHSIKRIVIHHWGDDGQSFMGVVNWLCRNGSESSAHYVLEDGRVACIVNPEDTAWHAGNWNANLESIGIECRPEMTDGDLRTLAELISILWETYGYLPLCGHCDIKPTACPGRYYPMLGHIEELAKGSSAEVLPEPSVPTPTPSSVTKSVDELAKEVLQGLWGNGDAREQALTDAGYDYNAVQNAVNVAVLGTSYHPIPEPTYSVSEIVNQVIRGDWGIGSDRVARLTNAGYDYDTIQAEVNRVLLG